MAGLQLIRIDKRSPIEVGVYNALSQEPSIMDIYNQVI